MQGTPFTTTVFVDSTANYAIDTIPARTDYTLCFRLANVGKETQDNLRIAPDSTTIAPPKSYGMKRIPAQGKAITVGSRFTTQFTQDFNMDSTEITRAFYDSLMRQTYPNNYITPLMGSQWRLLGLG